jgi:outer membrane protein
MTLMLACLQGCADFGDRPEMAPDKWAPPHSDREWSPSPVLNSQHPSAKPPLAAGAEQYMTILTTSKYDLPNVIDIALNNNPTTQGAWAAARSAAASFGSAQAPYYPQVAVETDAGYTREIIPLPGDQAALSQWQVEPLVSLNYTILDFGRRRAASDSAQSRLIATDLRFNRSIQTVVFDTEVAFYGLDAADGAVIAAQENFKLASTDFEAVQQRVNLGLATQPELLLAKEQVAQSRFDLANAQLMVHDAEAQMAVALGVPADPPVEIVGLESQTIPPGLNQSVEELIAQARRERPDLAAEAASLRARQSDIEEARAQFYPTFQLSTMYGETFSNFTLETPETVQTVQPQYSVLLSLRWEIFTGFKHLNDLRGARSDSEVARAELRSAELDTIAQVWRAYYELDSSRSKYDFAQALLAASEESYQANLETYREGLSTIVELLTAERDLANARYTLISSKAQLLTSYASVAYAAGAVRYP